ncbi:MAG: NAD(P)/FAD-dependent oxidoreductase [Solirubrobacteraceae bacterium]
MTARAKPTPAYADQPTRSPWLAQLANDGPPRPLSGDAVCDVAVVGAGIAGVATAFFILRETSHNVVLIERSRVARGATGRNAGQMTTYFERPLCAIADEFGAELAVAAQRGFDTAHELFDLIVAETGATGRVERFEGHMGMFNLHHLEVHLRSNLIRSRGGWRTERSVVSDTAEFRHRIPAEFDGLYAVVPQARIAELLEVNDDRYCAVLSDRKGCANSGLLAQQVLGCLERSHASRFRYVDHTDVTGITVDGEGAILRAGDHEVTASSVVLCTNGFVDHAVLDSAGAPIRLAPDQEITGRTAYMAAFVEDEPRPPAALSYIRNTRIGGETAYVYVTRRTYDTPGDSVTLSCMGGPEYPFHEPVYNPDAPFPGALLTEMDDGVRPFAQPLREPRRPYDFQWHGLMGYNDSGIRVVGAHPEHPTLLYNLGCNGVGFLPSIFGGHRVSRLLAGDKLSPSIFDPR